MFDIGEIVSGIIRGVIARFTAILQQLTGSTPNLQGVFNEALIRRIEQRLERQFAACITAAKRAAETEVRRELPALLSTLIRATPIKTGEAAASIDVGVGNPPNAPLARTFDFQYTESITFYAVMQVPYAPYITDPWFDDIITAWSRGVGRSSAQAFAVEFARCIRNFATR